MKATTQATHEITAATISRCTNKATHEVFYMIKSDSSDAWYQVRFDTRSAAWTCQCKATKPCKHERAVQDVLKIRRARIATQMGGSVPAVVAQMQTEEDKRIANVQVERRQVAQPVVVAASTKQQREAAPLNGNRAFSFMR